jgi:hypothetical protein
MSPMNRMASRFPCRVTAVGVFVVLLCVCVLTQMLGVPVTLLGLLNSDMLTNSEPVSEDFSALSTLPNPERPGLLSLIADFYPVPQLPVLPTSVFRPPSA